MGEARFGTAFIKRELDEAIAIQTCIVDAEAELGLSHPVASARRAIKAALVADERYLRRLKHLGRKHDASGEPEEVADGLIQLMESTLDTAAIEGNDSDFYEAHAVLVSLKRRQRDLARGIRAIARDQKDMELRDAAKAFQVAQEETSNDLTEELADFAVRIAARTAA